MGHVYLTTSLYSSPAIIQAGDKGFMLWLRSVCWINANSRDGNIPKAEVNAMLRDLSSNARTVARLLRIGLLIDHDDHYELPKCAGRSRLELWKLGPVGSPSRPAIPESVRQLVYARDGYACRFCGATERLSIDHIIPWSRGGAHDESNFQTLCRSCNSAKGARV